MSLAPPQCLGACAVCAACAAPVVLFLGSDAPACSYCGAPEPGDGRLACRCCRFFLPQCPSCIRARRLVAEGERASVLVCRACLPNPPLPSHQPA